MALIIWTTASAKLAGRESYVGWDSRTRQKRLGWRVQNNRFLLLPSKRPSNLASRVLGLAVKALPDAWERRVGKRPLLAETFVDPEGYKCTCYHAAGWINCGRMPGYARVSGRDFYQDNQRGIARPLDVLAERIRLFSCAMVVLLMECCGRGGIQPGRSLSLTAG